MKVAKTSRGLWVTIRRARSRRSGPHLAQLREVDLSGGAICEGRTLMPNRGGYSYAIESFFIL